MIVFGEHDIGFDGTKLVVIDTIRADWLTQVGTVDIWSVKGMDNDEAQRRTGILCCDQAGMVSRSNQAF
jgi:hypothetical protein